MYLIKVNTKESAYIEIPYLKRNGYGIVKPTNVEHYYMCSQKGIETIDIVMVKEI